MSILKLFASTVLASLIATPALAQAVIDEPGFCAQFYPIGNCNNEGPDNPELASRRTRLGRSPGAELDRLRCPEATNPEAQQEAVCVPP